MITCVGVLQLRHATCTAATCRAASYFTTLVHTLLVPGFVLHPRTSVVYYMRIFSQNTPGL